MVVFVVCTIYIVSNCCSLQHKSEVSPMKAVYHLWKQCITYESSKALMLIEEKKIDWLVGV
jgi:hypothetical protein